MLLTDRTVSSRQTFFALRCTAGFSSDWLIGVRRLLHCAVFVIAAQCDWFSSALCLSSPPVAFVIFACRFCHRCLSCLSSPLVAFIIAVCFVCCCFFLQCFLLLLSCRFLPLSARLCRNVIELRFAPCAAGCFVII